MKIHQKGKCKLQNTSFILQINKMYNHNANFTHCCQVCLSLRRKTKSFDETCQQEATQRPDQSVGGGAQKHR